MLNLPQKTLNIIKARLQKQQKEVEKELKGLEKEDPAKEENLPESSEPGSESFMAELHTRSLALGGQLKGSAISIKNALMKINKGTYGRCEQCGKHIEEDRLKAIPTAILCMSCSKKAGAKKAVAQKANK